ncbi:hypothetical protein B0T25DRAFT_541005 [Lasiosphaeria hispida]|uniref:Uncharacterized protein n=1 Tax=Lasiosphaeria hispida TaxID=260671 RepID=A0AAJ0MGT5_9PEZI|nr:hypothetical protein B0T25DRAFT_541005 [Lasiosphaeria hispida]
MEPVEPEPTPSSIPLNPANTFFSSTSTSSITTSSTTTSSTPDLADLLPTVCKKRGRPCTGIADRYNKRAYNPPPLKKKTKVFRTRVFKIKVLDYLIFNIVPVTENDHNDRIRSNMPSITILDGEWIILGPVYLFRARWAALECELFNLFVNFFFISIMILLILNLSAL